MKIKGNQDGIVAGGVALAAFAASAQHIFHVCEAAGNPTLVAALHPAGIDGLIYIGIRAMQSGRKGPGGLAVAYGAVYSLAFNAASYGGFAMPVWALAACMPLAMFFAFLIVHSGHKAAPVAEVVERIVEVAVERIVEVPVLPALLPIVPFQPAVEPVRIPTLPKAVAAGSTRPARWDVEKAVAMILDGRTDVEVADAVGSSAKVVGRTARTVRLLESGHSSEEVAELVPISLAHVVRVRDAIRAVRPSV